MSARSIRSVLKSDRYTVTEVGITPDGAWLTGDSVIEAFESKRYEALHPVILLPEPNNAVLYRIQENESASVLEEITCFDVIFPVLHGTFGEDGTVQGLLELADLAYVSGGVLASSVGMDKALFKEVMRANGIPVLDSKLLTRRQIETDPQDLLLEIEQNLPYPVFVKPANLGSSVGVSKCRNRSELLSGLSLAAEFDRRVLVETGIDAREIEVSVLGNENPRASLPGEIIPGDEFYSYRAKYLDDTSRLIIPAALDEELVKRVQMLAIEAYQLCDSAGMARVDFLLDRGTNRLFLHEINTIPGFTKISMYPKLWEASGLSYEDLVHELIKLAIERKLERDRTRRSFI